MIDALVNCRGGTLLLATILAMASAPAVTAQLSGTVREPGGIPVAEATVALWKGSREMARTVTDAQGDFRFAGDSSPEATVLLVRRIGFRPTSMPLGVKRSGLSVTLEPVATALPEVVTTAARRACPNRDEPEARQLWHALSEHYATHLHSDDIQASSIGRGGEVTAMEVGNVDESRFRPGGFAMLGERREALFRSIDHDGYARRLKPGDDLIGEYFYWRYARLDRELSEHFVESDFARNHSLGLWRTDDGSLTITFCGRDHSRPYLEGTLLISRDTALIAARWKYRTPSPHEDAGAEVTFLSPPRRASIWLLVPLRSVFWRRLGGSDKLYVREAFAYREWKVGPYAVRGATGTGI
jgi:hypothetical protein